MLVKHVARAPFGVEFLTNIILQSSPWQIKASCNVSVLFFHLLGSFVCTISLLVLHTVGKLCC
ncbi:unnamed protein product [Ixodes persulcatus]